MANRELEDFLMENLGKGLGARGVIEAARKRFPEVTGGEFGAALEQARSRLRAQHTELGLDLAEVHHAIDDGSPAAALGIMNSPGFRAFKAKLHAAAEHHPDWSRTPDGGWLGPDSDDRPQGDTTQLIIWFERTHPAEAVRITAEALAN